jgi:hypothetical protein
MIKKPRGVQASETPGVQGNASIPPIPVNFGQQEIANAFGYSIAHGVSIEEARAHLGDKPLAGRQVLRRLVRWVGGD